MMDSSDLDGFEIALRASAAEMAYPSTPPIAAAVSARLQAAPGPVRRSRPWAWALVAVLVVISALLLVPPARAAILDFIQIGVVRILRGPVAPPVPIPLTATPGVPQAPTALPVTPVQPSAMPPSQALGLAGQMSLQQAARKTGFHILLPTHPPDLGPPDAVYVQDQGSPMLLLVWLDPQDPARVRMTLHEIAPGSWAITKYDPRVLQETTVAGERAIWTEGPYMLQASNGDYVERRLVNGHVLIWAHANITYRLESDLLLEEAVKVAESLAPIP
jgi:hypothetical protein